MSLARAVSPVVGIALVLALTLTVSSVVAVGTFDFAAAREPVEPTYATFSATANASTGQVTLTHRGGGAIDVGELRVVVAVDGEELRYQPPVPFFSARGFVSGPTGPFNPSADQRWTAGETASFTVAGTNAPTVTVESVVFVTLVVDGATVGDVRAVVGQRPVSTSASRTPCFDVAIPASRESRRVAERRVRSREEGRGTYRNG